MKDRLKCKIMVYASRYLDMNPVDALDLPVEKMFVISKKKHFIVWNIYFEFVSILIYLKSIFVWDEKEDSKQLPWD